MKVINKWNILKNGTSKMKYLHINILEEKKDENHYPCHNHHQQQQWHPHHHHHHHNLPTVIQWSSLSGQCESLWQADHKKKMVTCLKTWEKSHKAKEKENNFTRDRKIKIKKKKLQMNELSRKPHLFLW